MLARPELRRKKWPCCSPLLLLPSPPAIAGQPEFSFAGHHSTPTLTRRAVPDCTRTSPAPRAVGARRHPPARSRRTSSSRPRGTAPRSSASPRPSSARRGLQRRTPEMMLLTAARRSAGRPWAPRRSPRPSRMTSRGHTSLQVRNPATPGRDSNSFIDHPGLRVHTFVFGSLLVIAGNLTLRAYEEDCEFADPAGSFRGLGRFKRNCTNFGSLLEKSDMKLTKWEDLQVRLLHFACSSIEQQPAKLHLVVLIPLPLLGFRTNRSGTGVSAASCRSRGGPFSPVSPCPLFIVCADPQPFRNAF